MFIGFYTLTVFVQHIATVLLCVAFTCGQFIFVSSILWSIFSCLPI